MASSTFSKFYSFVEDVGKAIHDLQSGGDTIKILLTNDAPNAGDTYVDDASTPCRIQAVSAGTEVAAFSGYTKGGATIGSQQYAQSGGVAKFYGTLVSWTAGAASGSFRYAVIYNASKGSAGSRPVIGYWDYGSSISLGVGESFSIGNSNDGSDWTSTYPILSLT